MTNAAVQRSATKTSNGAMVSPGVAALPTEMQQQKRGIANYPRLVLYSTGRGKFIFPAAHMRPINSDYIKSKTFHDVKGRDQWDYNKIDETLTRQSEFNNMEGRDMFYGTRDYDIKYGQPAMQDETWCNHPKRVKPLHQYFDEYTQPGTDDKYEAARAMQEHWDSENFYYPGENWKRNRPAFRAVPKEVLNKETWYNFVSCCQNVEKICTQHRPRNWVPRWPPPGFRMPKYPARKDLHIGLEHPELVHEYERWYWYRMWDHQNVRYGWAELVFFWWCFWLGWVTMKTATGQQLMMHLVWSNQWYPGKFMVRSYGEANNAEDGFWWQYPLDDTQWFKDPGFIWYFNEIRFGFINYENRQAELAAIHGGEENIPKEKSMDHLGGNFPSLVKRHGTYPYIFAGFGAG